MSRMTLVGGENKVESGLYRDGSFELRKREYRWCGEDNIQQTAYYGSTVGIFGIFNI